MAGVVLLLVPALWLLGFACGRRSRAPRARGLYLPLGGSMRPVPPASASANPATVERVLTFTGCKQDGPWQEAPDRQARLAVLSRTTAPTASTSGPFATSGMVTRHGIPTTGADTLDAA